MIDPDAAAAAAVPLVRAVASAAMENAPVVKTASGEAVATGVWALVGIVVTSLGTLFGLWLRYGTKWRELALGARKSDIERLDGLVEDIRKELKVESDARVNAQLQLSYVVAAFGMVSAELERQDPTNGVIKAARSMIARATMKDGLGGDLIRALDMAPDVPLNGG